MPPPRPRVLIVGPLPPPLGGVQRMIEMLAGSSLSREFELHTVDTSKGVLRWAVETQSWRTPFYFARDLGRLVRALLSLRPRVVIVHAASGWSFARDWAFLATARLSGARVICHYHGTLHTHFPSVQSASGRRIGRLMMSAAHRVIVLGPTFQREMGAAWKRADLVWSPNLVDIARFSAPKERPAALASGERAVLFVGRLSAPKGITDLFDCVPEVLARHPEARFLLAGVAENDAREPELRADVLRRGIAERVSFLGSLEGADLARAYTSSAVFVSPSWTEAFPLVIPEAMAAGLPLVVTAVGAIPDFVKNGEDGFLIPPHDPAALADRIVRLLSDETLRARISARVRARAESEFAIEVGAERVRAVIEDVLRGSA